VKSLSQKSERGGEKRERRENVEEHTPSLTHRLAAALAECTASSSDPAQQKVTNQALGFGKLCTVNRTRTDHFNFAFRRNNLRKNAIFTE